MFVCVCVCVFVFLCVLACACSCRVRVRVYILKKFYLILRLGNGYIFCTTKSVNPEYAGLLVSCEDDDIPHNVESDLLSYDEPRSINTNSTYLNGSVMGSGYLDTSIIDDEDEDVTFDRTQSLKNGHMVVDVNGMDGIG